MTTQPASGRRRSGGLVAALLSMSCTVAACSGEAPHAPPARTASPPAPPTRTWSPQSDDEEAACRTKDPKPWRPSNDPYAGPGPHYIYPVRVQLDPDAAENAIGGMDLSSVPDDMQIPNGRVPDGWQLIACVYHGHPTRRSGTVSCYFDNVHKTRKYPLYESRYRVIVREARTGKKVATLSVPGTTTDDGNCPSFVVDTGDTIILKPLDGRSLGERLRPVVDGTA